jgi:hypothetical protein
MDSVTRAFLTVNNPRSAEHSGEPACGRTGAEAGCLPSSAPLVNLIIESLKQIYGGDLCLVRG